VGLLDAWIAMFVWFPLIFAWQVLTYILERIGKLSPPSEESLAARDALPLIRVEQEVVSVGSAAITPERNEKA
jgi:hypothetical protein